MHVTLKQPCVIEDKEVDILKQKVAQFFSEFLVNGYVINVNFDEIVTGKSDSGSIIMVGAREPLELAELQHNLCAYLSDYNNYLNPETRAYEEIFWPHITIAYDLPEETLQEALGLLKDGCELSAEISEAILFVVAENTPEEARDPNNKTIYKF